MTNQRSVMTEFRALEQKRQAEGLTADEAARLAQLRDLVGPETVVPRPGFDVNAAAARLRESLLPAGLRNRPSEPAPPPPPPPEPEWPAAAEAVEQPWADVPPAPPPPPDPLFDPASLGREVKPQAWNPEAPGYDPDAPYDEGAWIAAGYDPNVTYDWSAYGYGPDGQPLASASTEPAPEPPPIEPAQAEAETAPPPDEYPAAGAPTGEPAWMGEALPVDLEFTPGPASAVLLRGQAAGSAEAADEAGLAEPPAGEESWGYVSESQPDLEPLELVERAEPPPHVPSPEAPSLDLDAEPAVAAGPSLADPALVEPQIARVEAAPWPEPDVPVIEATPEPAPQVAAPAFGEYDETGGAVPLASAFGEPPLDAVAESEVAAPATPDGETEGDPGIQPYLPAPPGAAFGDYDEVEVAAPAADAALEAMLPFDPAAASAIGPDSMPEGYEVTEPASSEPAAADQAAFGSDSMYGGPEGESLPGGPALDPGEISAEWQPETALEQGFELASEGSFGHEEVEPVAPVWSPHLPTPPASAPESPPALDLSTSFEPPAETSRIDASPLVTALEPELGDDLPTIEGEEILEELPPDAAVAAAGWEPEPALSYEPAPEEAIPPEIAAAYAETSRDAATFEPPPAVATSLVPPAAAPAIEGAPPGPAFEPSREPEPMEAEPLPPPAPTALIEGTHRVVLHTVDGQVKRGLLSDALLDAEFLTLHPQGTGAPDVMRSDAVKAIFFMLAPGEKAPPPEGKKVRVTFRDGRQVAGYSPDYQEGLVGFFMIPADTRTNTGRIWVYQSAVRQVAVS